MDDNPVLLLMIVVMFVAGLFLPEGRACSPAGGICKRRLYEGVCRRL